MSWLIAGISTGVGKTLVSALICEATGADYWKPVQAGDLQNSDSIIVKKLVNNKGLKIHPEAYRLLEAASLHYAAELEGIRISREGINLPVTDKPIVVETAGGLLSPLSENFFNIDLASHLSLPVILVVNNYLGSINHSLLSVEALRERKIKIRGIVFSGKKVPHAENFILKHSGLPLLFSVPFLSNPDADTISGQAALIRDL
jgi:dethiobiotin synthetase